MTDTNVSAIRPDRTMSMFFDRIYGPQEGWVYVPTKVPGDSGAWTKRFWQWPSQKSEMIEYILAETATKEVYYGPALYKEDCTENSITTEHFKGSYFVWAEFDGVMPTDEELAKVPAPTIKIKSSTSKHEHWYWALDFLETDPRSLEKISKSLAYLLGADLSGWDYTQVLRPPGTLHHESGQVTRLLEDNDTFRYSITRFAELPAVPDHVWDVEIVGDVPASLDVLLMYKIPKDELSLIKKKEQPVGKRSSALSRVAYVCAEAGMSNIEMLSVLLWKDNDWGKFKRRGPEGQKRAIVGLIRNIRKKKPVASLNDIDVDIPWYTAREFRALDIEVDWLVPSLLTTKSIMFLSGPSDVGKTKFSYSLAMHMALGKPYLGFQFTRPMRLVIVQMESPAEETLDAFEECLLSFTEEEQDVIQDNLMWVPPGYSVNIMYPRIREQLLVRLDTFKPEGILWDSFQTALGGEILDAVHLNEVFDFLKRSLAVERNIFNIFLHHNRKAQIGNKKPKTIDDLLGGQTIVSVATTILGLWREDPNAAIVELYKIKSRYAKTVETVKMHHKEAYVFEVSNPEFVSLDDSMTDSDEPFGGFNDDDLSIV